MRTTIGRYVKRNAPTNSHHCAPTHIPSEPGRVEVVLYQAKETRGTVSHAGTARVLAKSWRTGSRGKGAVTTVERISATRFYFRNTVTNKGRRIKTERSNLSHLFHRCFPPTHPCATQPSFLLLYLCGFGHFHNEILRFFRHFCRTLCGRGIRPVDHQHTVSSFPNFPNYILFSNSFFRTNVISCTPLQISFSGGTRSFPLLVSRKSTDHASHLAPYIIVCITHVILLSLLIQGQPS